MQKRRAYCKKGIYLENYKHKHFFFLLNCAKASVLDVPFKDSLWLLCGASPSDLAMLTSCLIWFRCVWVLVLYVGLYFLSTFDKKLVCCVLEYHLKLLLFNKSAQGFMLLFVPFTVECHLALSLSLLSAYLPPLRNHTALLVLTHHIYIGHIWFYVLFILISLSVWSQAAPGYTIIYYKWQIWRRRSSAVLYLWLLYWWQKIVLWHSSAWVFLKKFQGGGTDMLCKF